MRKLLLSILLFASLSVFAQRKIVPTSSIKIEGKIKAEKTFTLLDLDTFKKVPIPDQIIYNHKGEAKDTLQNLKGVLLKTILESIEFIYEKPRYLNEFYFVFIASDGYKVVFSWNEIYNTEIGNSLFIITEMEGKKRDEIDNRIIFIATNDFKSGRRYIKGLEKIVLRQVD